MPKIIQPEALMTKKEAAQFLRITVRTLENWVREGHVSQLKISRTVRFRRDVLLEDLKRNQVSAE
jgi:excisionase family DNA binding protein